MRVSVFSVCGPAAGTGPDELSPLGFFISADVAGVGWKPVDGSGIRATDQPQLPPTPARLPRASLGCLCHLELLGGVKCNYGWVWGRLLSSGLRDQHLD